MSCTGHFPEPWATSSTYTMISKKKTFRHLEILKGFYYGLYQLSTISNQPLAISHQPKAIPFQLDYRSCAAAWQFPYPYLRIFSWFPALSLLCNRLSAEGLHFRFRY